MEKILHYLGSLCFSGTQATVKRQFVEYVEYKCHRCGIKEYENEHIPLDMHHIDGNRNNNRLCNLQLLCGNCHKQTDNYGKKNKIRYEKTNGI